MLARGGEARASRVDAVDPYEYHFCAGGAQVIRHPTGCVTFTGRMNPHLRMRGRPAPTKNRRRPVWQSLRRFSTADERHPRRVIVNPTGCVTFTGRMNPHLPLRGRPAPTKNWRRPVWQSLRRFSTADERHPRRVIVNPTGCVTFTGRMNPHLRMRGRPASTKNRRRPVWQSLRRFSTAGFVEAITFPPRGINDEYFMAIMSIIGLAP